MSEWKALEKRLRRRGDEQSREKAGELTLFHLQKGLGGTSSRSICIRPAGGPVVTLRIFSTVDIRRLSFDTAILSGRWKF
jgi:hypothetical protein